MLWATLDHGVQLSKYDHPQLVIQAASKGGYIRPFSSQGDTFCCRESGVQGEVWLLSAHCNVSTASRHTECP